MYPELTQRRDGDVELPVLVWRPAEPVLMISSGALGGGIGTRRWVINATVPMSYARSDPDAHLVELAGDLGLAGPGTGLLTGVDVATVVTAPDAGVTVWATVGLTDPIWAAAPPASARRRVGTVNVVAWVPARLSEAALVNAVATVAEAKVQALVELEVPGTGTCTDATVLACPTTGPVQPYGGPRSDWGAPLARAVYAAVLRGGRGTFGWPGSDRVRRDPPLPPGTNQT